MAKASKQSVNYRLGGPHCHACMHFVEGKEEGPGTCDLVSGSIDEHQVCDLFMRKTMKALRLASTAPHVRDIEGSNMRTKRISADEAHHLRKDQMRQGSDGSELLMKAARSPSTWDSASRSARFVMTSQSVDRMGDVVVTAGLDTAEFEQNPVALMSHRSDTWPIGEWKNVEKMLRGRPPRMEGDLSFLKAGGPNPDVDTAAWYAENGFIRGASIGFIPDFEQMEMLMDVDGSWSGGLQFNAAKVVECSLCAIPANQDALAKMITAKRGLAKEWIEDVLDNWARSPEGVLTSRTDWEKAYQVVKTRSTLDRSMMDGNWKCGASRGLPISEDTAWDGGAAAERMLDAANIGGDPDAASGKSAGGPDYAMAAKGFLAHDSSSPDLRGSYKLPFADMVGGKMTAMPGGLRAAASRLPQTDIPDNCMSEARTVLDGYFAQMDNKILLDFAGKEFAKMGKVVVDQDRAETIERTAKRQRLEERRGREKLIREQKIEELKRSG